MKRRFKEVRHDEFLLPKGYWTVETAEDRKKLSPATPIITLSSETIVSEEEESKRKL